MMNQGGFFHPQKRKSCCRNGCDRHGYRGRVSTQTEDNEHSPRFASFYWKMEFLCRTTMGGPDLLDLLDLLNVGPADEMLSQWLQEDVRRTTCSTQKGQTGPA